MKQVFKVLTVFSVMAAFAFIPPKHNLVGHWIAYERDGSIGAYINFKTDGTYNIELPNGQIGEMGSYKLDNSIFSIKNAKPVCGDDYWGSYTITFHGRDSVSFALIKDSCTSRREDIVGGNAGLKKLKAK
jgi:hypothetical protein